MLKSIFLAGIIIAVAIAVFQAGVRILDLIQWFIFKFGAEHRILAIVSGILIIWVLLALFIWVMGRLLE